LTRWTAIPLLVLAILAEALRAVDEAPVRSQKGGGAMVIRPTLKDRLSALEPLEPVPVAEAAPNF
jgi:hypothetical protein